MGVHDYTCSVCGTPLSYECHEVDGGECGESGIGEDQAIVDLYVFAAADAPTSPDQLEARLDRARRLLTQARGYDWGAWEFVPSLNYRDPADGRQRSGRGLARQAVPPARRRQPHRRPRVGADEVVWAVNYCPPCRRRFVDGAALDAPCQAYLRAIADHLGLAWSADKAAMAASVAARVARRRPARGD
jgi:hypothetical protein